MPRKLKPLSGWRKKWQKSARDELRTAYALEATDEPVAQRCGYFASESAPDAYRRLCEKATNGFQPACFSQTKPSGATRRWKTLGRTLEKTSFRPENGRITQVTPHRYPMVRRRTGDVGQTRKSGWVEGSCSHQDHYHCGCSDPYVDATGLLQLRKKILQKGWAPATDDID